MSVNESEKSGTAALLQQLQERAKELSCLYRVEELLVDMSRPIEEVLQPLVEALPSGWQYPGICEARITLGQHEFRTAGFVEKASMQCSLISEGTSIIGRICIAYREDMPPADNGPFLQEEMRLLETVARRIGDHVLHQRLKSMFKGQAELAKGTGRSAQSEWRIMTGFLKATDQRLLIQISRKMTNYLCWKGVKEAQELLRRFSEVMHLEENSPEANEPQKAMPYESFLDLAEQTFSVAEAILQADEILGLINRWIAQDRFSFLVRSVCNEHSPMSEISDTVLRYQRMGGNGEHLTPSARCSVKIALIRRLFTDDLSFINVAEKYVEMEQLFGILDHIIYPSGSHGRLGGKGSGLILASCILAKASARSSLVGSVRVPRTWYLPADNLYSFIDYNDLEEISEQKYKSLEDIRREYAHVVQIFKNSRFPAEIRKGLSAVLDEVGPVPLIVRSSSLLEDRLGAAFSGKYKSLFLPNQGDKSKRLEALLDAIAEVYASTFAPDPIQYRAERGLLNFNEEMGILVQEVVGSQVGQYFFPAYAGVAFSRNELRWSPRIRRNDGLLRLVPGLGTRAVDRLGDDYPVMVSPGQPALRVNATLEESIRYSPRKLDAIDLMSRRFKTLEVSSLLQEHGSGYPGLSQIASIYRDGRLERMNALTYQPSKDTAVITFEGLLSKGTFINRIAEILRILEDALETAVDIEFASDGTDLYLLQCRPQNLAAQDSPAILPRKASNADVVFTAHRFVSNGKLTGISYIVYVDPAAYSRLSNLAALHGVGQLIGRLNSILPRGRFILMGPGRWGSRGDIKLGVKVSYSDINNTAMLIEIARKSGQYVPDLSFGTHFFQDLVEGGIKYLPLYPDEPNEKFNEEILSKSPNALARLLPECAVLSDTVRVIDLGARGVSLSVYMNAEEDEAMAVLEPVMR